MPTSKNTDLQYLVFKTGETIPYILKTNIQTTLVFIVTGFMFGTTIDKLFPVYDNEKPLYRIMLEIFLQLFVMMFVYVIMFRVCEMIPDVIATHDPVIGRNTKFSQPIAIFTLMASQVNLFKKIAFASQQFFNFRDPQEEEFSDEISPEEIPKDIINESTKESDINSLSQSSQNSGGCATGGCATGGCNMPNQGGENMSYSVGMEPMPNIGMGGGINGSIGMGMDHMMNGPMGNGMGGGYGTSTEMFNNPGSMYNNVYSTGGF